MKWKLSLLLIIFLTFFKAQDTISEVLTYKAVTYKKADTAEQKLDIYASRKFDDKSPGGDLCARRRMEQR